MSKKINKINYMIKRVFVIFCFFCFQSLNLFAQEKEDKFLIKEGIGVENFIFIGQKKHDVIRKLGRPKRIGRDRTIYKSETHSFTKVRVWKTLDRTRNHFVYKNLWFEVFFDKGIVVEIVFKSSRYRTLSGYSIGDSREKVFPMDKKSDNFYEVVHKFREGMEYVFFCNYLREIRVFKPREL